MAEARVTGLARRAKPHADMEPLDSCEVTVDKGVAGDYRGEHGEADRRVTVLFVEQWQAACEESGGELPWTARRANVLVEGGENPRMVGERITLGDVVLEVTQECAPCSRMDAAQQGLRSAMESDWRGGVACRVVQGGQLALGDAVASQGAESAA